MEDTTDPVQPTEPTQVVAPVQTEPAVPVTETTPAVAPGLSASEAGVSEETFLRKNKMLIIGGIVGLIVVTVIVGILLSLKNSEKLEGLIKFREAQTQEQPTKIPTK